MIRNILNRIKKAPDNKKPIVEVTQLLEQIRRHSDVLAISPESTELSYLGIKMGMLSLFPNCYMALSHYYSTPLYTENELAQIGKIIADLGFKKVVFRGITKLHFPLLKSLKKGHTAIRIFYLHSGSASEFHSKKMQEQLLFLKESVESGLIHKIGFNKQGLNDVFSVLFGVPCSRYIMKSTVAHNRAPKENLSFSSPNIGVWGNSGFNKNVASQILAALYVNNSTVHILENDDYVFFKQERVVRYKAPVPHAELMALIRNMHINYYLSFSETWGHVVTESLAMGTPCLTTSSSGMFDFDPELKHYLVVDNYDNLTAIAQKTKQVFENYDWIVNRGHEYLEKTNRLADELLIKLLEE